MMTVRSDDVWHIDRRQMWPPQGRVLLPISPSTYETCRLCMLQATFDASPGYARRGSPPARLGIAFHETLENMSRIAGATSAREARAEAVATFDRAMAKQREQAERNPRERGAPWPETTIQRMQIALSLLAGQQVAERLAHRVELTTVKAPYTSFKEKLRSGVEEKLRSGVIVGRLDRVDHSSGDVVIVDYKTGALHDERLARYRRQCLVYAWLWHETTDEWPTKYRIINPIDDTEIQAPVDSEAACLVVEDMERMAKDVSQHIPPDQQASPGAHCAHCQYRPWCEPYWDSVSGRGVAYAGESVYRRVTLQARSTAHAVQKAGKLFVEVRTRVGTATVEFDPDRFAHLKGVPVGTRLRLIDARQPSLESLWFVLDDRSEAFLVVAPLPAPTGGASNVSIDVDLFEPSWHPLIARLTRIDGIEIDAGGDVVHDGRVVGSYLAEVMTGAGEGVEGAIVSPHARTIQLIDGDALDAEDVREVLQARGDVITVYRADVDGAVIAVRAALGKEG